MRMSLFCLSFACVVAGGFESDNVSNSAVAQFSDQVAQTEKVFKTWNRPDSPGCAVGIVKDGKLVYANGFGIANFQTGA